MALSLDEEKQLLGELKQGLIEKTAESEEKIEALIKNAVQSALTLTNRTHLTRELGPIIEELSLIMHNREGEEGESLRREGSLEIRRKELPEILYRQITALRIARLGI